MTKADQIDRALHRAEFASEVISKEIDDINAQLHAAKQGKLVLSSEEQHRLGERLAELYKRDGEIGEALLKGSAAPHLRRV